MFNYFFKKIVSIPESYTLSEYIRCELKRGYLLQNDEQRYRERREKFYIFLKIPYKLETVLNLLISTSIF